MMGDQMDGWMNGWKQWVDGLFDLLMDEWRDRWIAGFTRLVDGQMDGWISVTD